MKRYALAAALILPILAAVVLIPNTPISGQMASLVGSFTDRYTEACLVEHGLNDVTVASTNRIHVDDVDPIDMVVQLEGDAHCGNTGCRYELCTIVGEEVIAVPFGFAGNSIESSSVVTNNRRNMIIYSINGDTELEWDGNRYLMAQ